MAVEGEGNMASLDDTYRSWEGSNTPYVDSPSTNEGGLRGDWMGIKESTKK